MDFHVLQVISCDRRIDREWREGRSPYPDIATTEGFHMHMTLQMGMHRMKANLAWCKEVSRQIEERLATTERSHR